MGYYIQTPENCDKAEQIRDLYGGEIVHTISLDYDKLPEGKALIVVVDNGPFEAAAFAYNEREFEEFVKRPDPRPKKFVLLDRELAEELTHFNDEKPTY